MLVIDLLNFKIRFSACSGCIWCPTILLEPIFCKKKCFQNSNKPSKQVSSLIIHQFLMFLWANTTSKNTNFEYYMFNEIYNFAQ